MILDDFKALSKAHWKALWKAVLLVSSFITGYQESLMRWVHDSRSQLAELSGTHLANMTPIIPVNKRPINDSLHFLSEVA